VIDHILIALVAVLVFRATRGGLAEGFPTAVFWLILLPRHLRIEHSAQIPELTAHRIILLILLFRWVQSPRVVVPRSGNLTGVLVISLIARCISDVFSITPGPSAKDFVVFALETCAFYALAASALTSTENRYVALRAATFALLLVAAIALLERYAGFNLPLVALSSFSYNSDGIQSTFPHRILLGFAMAMGTPLALLLLDRAKRRAQRIFYWLAVFALIATCFLADSRGGWLGMALGGGLSFVIGSRRTKRRCAAILMLAALTLLVRPGIRATISGRAMDTLAEGSYKGASYQYRWRLWNVAFSEINKSPERLLFGYGGLSTESMDLSQYFPPQKGGAPDKLGFTSWDNNYASDLIEFGLLGLGTEILLYGTIAIRLFRRTRTSPPPLRPFFGMLLASVLIFLFAQTNVYIFSEQLKFFFWTLVAVGLTARPWSPTATSLVPESLPSVTRVAPSLSV
jgi:O-antigen ligase